MFDLRSKWVATSLAAVAVMSGGLALAAGMSAEETIKARQDHLEDLGAAFKSLRDELRKSEPSDAALKKAAGEIATLSTQMHEWFPKGTGPESKVETEAKPEIWSDPQGFESAMKNFKAEAPKTQQLADAQDISGLKAHVGKLGGTCKGCHDKFRVPKD